MDRYICIHGHFYQPPRENPWLEAIELQDSAAPFHDWNARITAECYRPNARARIVDDADSSPERANDLATRFAAGRARTYPDLGALLGDPAVEAVDICLPHHLHAQTILAAARTLQLVLGAYRAAAERRTVALPEDPTSL